MKKKSHIKNNRRYYLHRKVKEIANLHAQNGTGIIYLDSLEIDEKYTKYIDQLRSIGYSVQLSIHCE